MAFNVSIFTLAAAAAALVVSILVYRGTTPALPPKLRVFLTGLRTVSFLLVVFLMTDPRIIRRSERIEAPTVIGLIDRSESMSLAARGWDGAGPTRFDAALEIARRVGEEVEREGGVFSPLFFSGTAVAAFGDSARADGQGTDVRGALEKVIAGHEGRNVAGVVLLSDGIDTEERLVRRRAPPAPVYAIGLGDTAAPEDVRVKDAEYSSVVGAPSRSSIRATVEYTGGPRPAGGNPKHVRLRLREGARTVFETDTVFAAGRREIVREIPVEFKEPGRRRFVLDVAVSGYDAEDENNFKEIVIEAEKSERKILVVDLSPAWELNFLAAFLQSEPSFDFAAVVPLSGHPSLGKERILPRSDFARRLFEYDALVILSVDAQFAEEATAIERFVREARKGLLVLPGPGSLFEHPAAWARLSGILPVEGPAPVRFNLRYTTLRPGPQGASHPVSAPLAAVFAQAQWQQRSPLLGCYAPLSPRSGTEVLLETEGAKSPALLAAAAGGGRVVLLAAGPLWRWKFLADDASVYDQLVSRMLDYLCRGAEAERFVLRANRNVYDSGEPGVLTGEVFDERMQPVTGVPVKVELSRIEEGGDVPLEVLSMQREGADNARFKAPLPPMGPGRYRIRGEATLGDRTIASAPMEITVSDVSVEFQRVQQDAANLKLLAAQSGGLYFGDGEVVGITERMTLGVSRVPTTSEAALRTSLFVFAAILLLLSVEWIVRKRAGMI